MMLIMAMRFICFGRVQENGTAFTRGRMQRFLMKEIQHKMIRAQTNRAKRCQHMKQAAKTSIKRA